MTDQIIRWHTNRGKRPVVYFYRDHHGTEVDFVISRGSILQLIECKWSENVRNEPAAFAAMRKRVPPEIDIQPTMITSWRGQRRLRGTDVQIYNCVDLDELLGRGIDSPHATDTY